jgi:hypothetical protein
MQHSVLLISGKDGNYSLQANSNAETELWCGGCGLAARRLMYFSQLAQ